MRPSSEHDRSSDVDFSWHPKRKTCQFETLGIDWQIVMPPLARHLLWYTALVLATAAPAAAQTLETTRLRHDSGNGGLASGNGPGGGLDVGPWPARGVPRPFVAAPASRILARLAGPALINAGRVDSDLTQACRAGRVALPRPRPRAVVGENTYVAAFGRDLVGARGAAAADSLYIFQYADANRCTVWEAGPDQP